MKINTVNLNFVLLLVFPLMFVIGNAAVNFHMLFSLFFLFLFKEVIIEMIKTNKRTSLFILLSYLYFIGNAIFVANNMDSIIFSLGLIKFIVLFFFVKISFDNLKDKINKILLCWVFFFLFLELDTLFQFFNGTNIIGIPSELIGSNIGCKNNLIFQVINDIYSNLKTCPSFLITSRLSGFFGSELVIGGFISYFFCILYGFLQHLEKRKTALFFLLISFFTVFFSGERMAFLSLSACLILFLAFRFDIKFFFTFTLLVLLSVFFIIQSPGASKRYKEINELNYSYSVNKKIDLPYYSLWKLSLYEFKNNIFFGMGIKNFRKSCNTEIKKNFIKNNFGLNACRNHSHNIYLEILAETGLVGFSIFFSIFLYFFFNILRVYFLNKANYVALSSLISIITILNPLKTSGSIFSTFFGLLMLSCIFLSYFISKSYVISKDSA
jgi:hypothetical protein